jgi:UDP-N-acetylglucosamine--dolichyl-phosphate N-acetylglucosaminephosphotransferase
MKLLPRAIDYHKPNRPKVPNGLGVFFVIFSTVYLFLLHYLKVEGALTLAGCILFGGFLGLLDDWVDLRWRYKAFTPILASLPLITLRAGETKMATYFFGKIDLGIYYYVFVVPLIITIITNSVNQLGGLNGLETINPLIIMIGLAVVSTERILLYFPILVCLILAFFNYQGRIFVGNTGSFALGITLASYSILANIEQTLLLATIPFLFNSTIILSNHFLFKKSPRLIMNGDRLSSTHRRSLQTIIAKDKLMSERRIVQIISLIMLSFTLLSVIISIIQ